jgi:hypothetical protein
MNESAYSGYEYTRYRPKRNYFVYILVPVVLAVIFFVANLLFGFVNFGKKGTAYVDCAQISFYVTTTTPQQSKSDAMRTAAEVKQNSGSGYLVSMENSWYVIDDIGFKPFEAGSDSLSTVTTLPAKITLAKSEHAELVNSLVTTFKTTFETLCDFLEKYDTDELTPSDISEQARQAYNTLVDMRGELEIIQTEFKHQPYSYLLAAVTYQLFGLNLLWLNTGANFEHTLKNSASWVIFAYKDLTTTLKI